MGIALPQLAPASEDRVSGAQVIDGSLKFDKDSSNYLKKTISTTGNQKTFTISLWFKKYLNTTSQYLFTTEYTGSGSYFELTSNADQLHVYNSKSTEVNVKLNRKFRDTSGWINTVIAIDTTIASPASDRVKIYVNGERQESFASSSFPTENYTFELSNSRDWLIGVAEFSGSLQGYYDGHISQFYLIDGQALGPENFGFTDPLTNTWRPKKFIAEPEVVQTVQPTYVNSSAVLDPTNAFDGSSGTEATYSGVNSWISFNVTDASNLSVPFTIRNDSSATGQTVAMFTDSGGSSAAGGFWDSTGNNTLSPAVSTTVNDVYTFPSTGTYYLRHTVGSDSNIFVYKIGGSVTTGGVGTNGFYLPMDGNSPIGKDLSNPNPVNNETVWSSGAGANFESANPASNGFNGSADSYTRTDNANVTATVTLPSAVPFTTLQVRGARDSGNGTITVNGVNVSSQYASGSATLQTITLTGVSSPLTSIALTGISGAAQPRFSQIIVDGIVLVDGLYGNSWTPVNFGGSVALDNPQVSGAKPILNTDGGGNVARPGVFGSEVGAYYAVTVASVGGGNRYHFDGVDRPNPTLIRGATYTFDQSDSTNSNHPLRFSTTSNGSHGGGSEYTDGVTTNGTPGSAGAYTKITVPHNSADTLYYYCTNHSNMGSSTSQITDETKADPYAWKNTLATPLVGSANDISNSVNSGSTTKTITVTNAVASSAVSNFYGGSWYFDGSGDYINASSNSDFTFGTGDFTIEGWVYPVTNNANKTVFSTNWGANGSIMITFSHPSAGGAGKFGFFDNTSSSGSPKVTTSNAYSVNNWYHIAFVRNGTSHKFYINGIEDGSATYSASDLTRDVFIFGAVYTNGTETFDGYMSDVRVYKGAAKYTSDFVVPATSPDILPDTPSGVSGGSKLAKVTDGAVSFDGSGDYLTSVESSDEYDFPSGDWTIEYFAYCNSEPSDAASFSNTKSFSSAYRSIIVEQNSGNISLLVNTTGSGGWTTVGTTTNDLNRWRHIALVRNSGTISFYVDGIGRGSTSSTPYDNANNDTVYFGRNGGDGSGYFSGFISNARIVKGTALYTSNFTPPTRALTNVTNTKLLCCQSNTSAGAAALSPNISGINDGTVWSSLGTGDADSPYRWEDTFDGNSSTYGAIAPQNSSLNLDLSGLPGGGLSYSSSVVIVVNRNSSAPDLLVNGVAQSITANGSDTTHTISGSGTLTSIGGQLRTAAGSGDMGIKSITVDGVALVDPLTPNGNAAATNFNPFNTDINTVRGQESGYCTWNPLTTPTNTNYSDGNLTINKTGGGHSSSYATMGMTTGKWYWEISKLTSTSDGGLGMGLVRDNQFHLAASTSGTDRYLIYLQSNDIYYYDGDTTELNFSSTAAFNDNPGTFMFAFDADNQKLYFGKDGSWTNGASGISGGNPSIGSGPLLDGFNAGETYFPWCTPYTSGQNMGANFGQKPFKFPPPAGFQPLNAANVKPETVITRPDHYVGVSLYTGTSGATSVSNLLFKPDLVWLKNRDSSSGWHQWRDVVRGGDKNLASNGTNAETDASTKNLIFNPNGFTLTGTTDSRDDNYDGDDYVAWCWKAGGNKNTFNIDDVGYATASAAGLTAGDTTPTGASVNTKSGFSIIKYTGPNDTNNHEVPHRLSQAPDFIITKNLDTTYNWDIYHSSLADDAYLIFTNASTRAQGFSGRPTSTVFKTEHDYSTNENQDYIAYLWHDVPGLQKFGSYEGNESTNGPYVELGFRPAILLVKNADEAGNDWKIYDGTRNPHNVVTQVLYPNLSNGEDANTGVDFLSNGFKWRDSGSSQNGAETIIYAAWAEAPTFNLYGAQSNAR